MVFSFYMYISIASYIYIIFSQIYLYWLNWLTFFFNLFVNSFYALVDPDCIKSIINDTSNTLTKENTNNDIDWWLVLCVLFLLREKNQWSLHKTIVWNQRFKKLSKLTTVTLTGVLMHRTRKLFAKIKLYFF